ncbi:MAG: potassium transporter TrkG [Bacteroidales bacterium]|jgi:potassium uptake TrkH family protein|nr:potassium transporter TrkG [Bacteroidales bacterium]
MLPAKKAINRIRETINLWLFPHKKFVLGSLRMLSFLVSSIALFSVVYYHGFPREGASDYVIYLITRGSLFFYVFKYLINIIYDFNPRVYMRRTWFEGILMLIIVMLGMFSSIFGIDGVYNFFMQIGFPDLPAIYILFVQSYVFVILGMELAKASQKIDQINLGPAGMLTLSFSILILTGTGLLMLPEMTISGEIGFIDALFTSTSASCVTGLIVHDTATFFTTKGHLIIMILIQLGGINIISFATFFATFYATGSGLKQQSLVKDLLTTGGLSDTRLILRRVIFFSVAIEFAVAIGLYITWHEPLNNFDSWNLAFYSIFHSISAFNNAGFSLFTDNLMDTRIANAWLSHWVIIFAVILGGLGFGALQDIFGLKSIRSRRANPWKRYKVQTRIVIYTSAILILFGALLFFALESHLLPKVGWFGKITTAIFQSVTARTAGFNTIDFSMLSQPMLLIFIVLMFIGASPGSTGGGIKTTTFLTLFKSAIATIRGKKHIEVLKHTLSFETVDKAYSVVLFSIGLVILSTFFLSITEENFSFLSLLFEEISAFATVGLSTGITAHLSETGRLIIILSMFVGRIGTLTLAMALMRKVSFKKYAYPHTDFTIG